MPRAIHFDLSADDPQRALNFYREVFCWKAEKWEGPDDYWLMTTGNENEPGITGGIAERARRDDSTAVIYDVESVDEFMEKIIASGGEIRERKRMLPGVGWLVMCRDTEGNTFGILQIDESARQP